MSKIKSVPAASFLALLVVFFLSAGSLDAQDKQSPVAEVSMSSARIIWNPLVDYNQLVLTVSGPNGVYVEKSFDAGSSPYLELSDINSGMLPDGSYTYELRVTPRMQTARRGVVSPVFMGRSGSEFARKAMVQGGYFHVHGGSIVLPAVEQTEIFAQQENLDSAQDICYADDLIVDGSLCVGFDCTCNYSFGFDTIVLKENNLRIFFDDTSVAGGFPGNDWRIVINDSANGGGSYFGVEDSTAGRRVFTLEAGAPTHSLYVDDGGRLGLGTSTPVVDLHIKSGNTPTMRLEQDGSSGFAPQTWDVAGNETNFFIRDASNGSTLPLRIRPGAPSNVIYIDTDGDVGMGSTSPDYDLDVQDSEAGGKAEIAAQRVGGATTIVRGTDSQGTFGTVTNHRLRLLANDTWRLEIETDNSLTMASGASCTAAGVWTNASSREFKENIAALSADDAVKTIKKLEPVVYNYKVDTREKYVGFIAEDVPELVAQQDRRTLSSMDITAVLTRVVKEQQNTIEEQRKMLEKLSRRIDRLEKKE